MKTKEKQLGKVKERIIFGRALKGSCMALAVFALAFVFLPYIMASVNAANEVALNYKWVPVSLQLDTDVAATTGGGSIDDDGHGDVNFGNLTPTENGTVNVQKKTISVTSSGTYYTVYLSMLNNDYGQKLQYMNKTEESDGQGGTTVSYSYADTSMAISPVNGTWSEPAALTNDTWGYAVPGSTNETAVTKAASGMDELSGYVAGTFYSVSDDATYGKAFAAVAPMSAPQPIWSDYSATGFGNYAQDKTGKTSTFDVYYGTKVGTDLLAGRYANEVVYTAVASASALDQVSNNIGYSKNYVAQNDAFTVYLDLNSSVNNNIISSDMVTVKLVPHDTVVAASYNTANLSFDDAANLVCANPTVSTNSETGIKVDCTLPVGVSDEQYDLWVKIGKYNYEYLTHVENTSGTDIGAVMYAGLQSKRLISDADTNKPVYTKMQEMTANICAQTYQWNQQWGDHAYLLDELGTTTISEVSGSKVTGKAAVNTIATVNTNTIASDISNGTYTLEDTRDGKKYMVRRLSDGYCWMVQNLDLDLYTGMVLTGEDTDLKNSSNPDGEQVTWTIASKQQDESLSDSAVNSWMNVVENHGGSLSPSWQRAHGIETATVYSNSYDTTNSAWGTESKVAECTGGTAQFPCFVTATASTDSTTNVNTITYEVKKIIVNGSPSSNNEVSDYFTSQTIGSCTFKVDADGVLTENNYCRVRTTGDATITQYDGMTGYGMEVPAIVGTAAGAALPTQGYDMDNDGTADSLVATDWDMTGFADRSIATNAGDFRWKNNGRDGAHVYDQGPTIYSNVFSGDSSTTDYQVPYECTSTDPDTNVVSNVMCSNTGTNEGVTSTLTAHFKNCEYTTTTSGTLELDGNTIDFTVCGASQGGEQLVDTHLAGNYYNWYAATAGSGTSAMTSGNAPSSICPSGWQLPVNTGARSFTNLLTNTSADSGYNLAITASLSKDTSLHTLPLAFIRGGYYNWGNKDYPTEMGAPRNRRSYGYYWSSTAYSTTSSRFLGFSSTRLLPSYGYNKGYGFAVRCVAR